MTSEPHISPEDREYLDRHFNEAACERLAQSNQKYRSSHSDYIVPLARLLNATRADLRELEEQLEALGEAIRLADNFIQQPLDLNYVAIPKDDWEIILAKVSIPAKIPE